MWSIKNTFSDLHATDALIILKASGVLIVFLHSVFLTVVIILGIQLQKRMKVCALKQQK